MIFSTTSVLRDIADIIMARGVPSSGCFFSRVPCACAVLFESQRAFELSPLQTRATAVDERRIALSMATFCGSALGGRQLLLLPRSRHHLVHLWLTAQPSFSLYPQERTPRGVDSEALERDLLGLPGVASVHDLHVWSLMPGKPLLAVHVVREAGAEADDVLASVRSHCRQRLGIAHVTIQVEGVGAECSLRTSEAGGGCGSHL